MIVLDIYEADDFGAQNLQLLSTPLEIVNG